MRRLTEAAEFSSEGERKLADLFASAERYCPDPLKKRRIGVQLHASRVRRPGARAWQPVVAIGIFFAGTAAAATLGHRIWGESASQPVEPPPKTRMLRAQNAPEHSPPTARAVDVPQQPLVHSKPEPERVVPHRIPPPRNQLIASKARPSTAHTEDPTRVAEALRALRKEGNADRAQSLLTEYMRDNPHGALSEEALALAIEAAHERKDPAARSYARRYLSRYPAGRHRPLAQRVLSE